jgi:16S rRNA (cytosine967-C5)-methyltransferase
VPALLQQLQALGGVDAVASAHLPQEFVRVRSGLQRVLRAGLVARGACTVQDEATGLVVALMDPLPGELVLDACAAPGGKALFTAARLQEKVRLA